MLAQSAAPVRRIRIALVGGDSAVRRERQLMLGSEDFDVRAYATSAALIADPNALASACIVVDIDMPVRGGIELVREMRVRGWCGAAILLGGPDLADAIAQSVEADGNIMLARTVADRPLLNAIRAALARNVAGNNSAH